MSNPETTETGSDLLVSASVCVVGVLAEALAQHEFAPQKGVDHVGCFGCDWVSYGIFPRSEHAAHVASVVAALPNIAVVMLPEPTVREHGGFSWGADEDGENPTVTATAGYDTVRLYQEDARHTSGDAAEIAGFLLAAARAAGGQA